jgi:hypothetical protein
MHAHEKTPPTHGHPPLSCQQAASQPPSAGRQCRGPMRSTHAVGTHGTHRGVQGTSCAHTLPCKRASGDPRTPRTSSQSKMECGRLRREMPSWLCRDCGRLQGASCKRDPPPGHSWTKKTGAAHVHAPAHADSHTCNTHKVTYAHSHTYSHTRTHTHSHTHTHTCNSSLQAQVPPTPPNTHTHTHTQRHQHTTQARGTGTHPMGSNSSISL